MASFSSLGHGDPRLGGRGAGACGEIPTPHHAALMQKTRDKAVFTLKAY
ncbi:MAG: hypothetical protein LBH18_04800 [Spirochaetaceae bacterium]|nr:hypothetical protein [Spirochaetaceae bacterium]